jgi:hypothetical protein
LWFIDAAAVDCQMVCLLWIWSLQVIDR